MTRESWPLIKERPLPAPGARVDAEALLTPCGRDPSSRPGVRLGRGRHIIARRLERALANGDLDAASAVPVTWSYHVPGRTAVRMRVSRRGAKPEGPHECECDFATGNFRLLRCVVEKVALTYSGPKRSREYAVAPADADADADADDADADDDDDADAGADADAEEASPRVGPP